LDAAKSFRTQFGSSLSAAANACLDDFIARRSDLIRDQNGSPDLREERVWAALVMLGAFGTEMNFIMSDTEELIRRRADRAFEHLQRMIVADSEFGTKRRTAFDRSEESCIQLGAAHSLLHGIWAFKANAKGERTDLVYQEPITDFTRMERSTEGLVLTEWKWAKAREDAARCFDEARRQVKLTRSDRSPASNLHPIGTPWLCRGNASLCRTTGGRRDLSLRQYRSRSRLAVTWQQRRGHDPHLEISAGDIAALGDEDLRS
jgi:hypothetical protein